MVSYMIGVVDQSLAFELHFERFFGYNLSVFAGTFSKISPLAQAEMVENQIL